MVKKNSIPERWRTLTAVGQRMPGSRFIAFKVPLKGVTNQRVTQNQKFTPKDLITAIRSQNEELGLIVDLTNTERYYTTKDLPKSVQYVKLHTAGLKIPDDATIHQFKRVAWKFLAANSDNDKLIGVHCTTGINRTGYLICRYLIDVDGWRPMHTLSAFAQSRGHPIEGTVYIEDIVKGPARSNTGIDLPPTVEETRAWDSGSYGQDDGPRDRGQREDPIRSLLELIPGNEYADFDARDRRPLPLMRARSDEYQEDGSRDFFNPRPELRGRGLPPRDASDDLDLRNRDFPSNMPDRMNAPERFRRPVDFNPDGRFNPGLENRRDFSGPEPRPLMDARDGYGPRDMQRPRGMAQEQMGYDDGRMRGRQSPAQDFNEYKEAPSYQSSFPPGKMNSAEYDDLEAEHTARPLTTAVEFRERLRRQQLQSMESENRRFDPREREMTTESFKAPFNERMQPRNTRTMEGPISERISARNTQLLGELINEIMNPRGRRDVEDAVQERAHPSDPRFMEDTVNERFPQRAAQGIRNAMDERMHLQDARPMNGPMNERIQSRDAQFMDGPMSNRMYSRDGRPIEASTNERMQTRVSRLMDLPLNERLNPRDGQTMENTMNDRIPPRALNRPANEMMTPRDARSMEGPLNARMNQRIERALEGTMNEQMLSREAPVIERVPLRDTRAMEGIMNERMYQRDVRTMPGSMNEQMQPRDARAMGGPMNEQMQSRDARAMGGPMNERMQPRDARAMGGPMNERLQPRNARAMGGPMNERMQPRDARALEGSMNERMYSHDAEFPMTKQRDFMNDSRPFEARKINPSEDMLRGTSRFAPYPSLMKPGQPAEIARGPLGHDNRDPRDILPALQEAPRFPPRSRFN